MTTLLDILTLLNALELALGLLTLAASFVTLRIAARHPLFHWNLMCLIASIAFHWLVAMVCRLGMVLWLFFDRLCLTSDDLFMLKGPIRYLEYGRIFAYCTVFGTIVSMMFERSVATIKLKSYEQQRSPFLVALSMLYSWFMGAISAYFVWQDWIPIIYPVILAAGYTSAILAVFIVVEYTNRKRYRQARRGIRTFTLSQRFQLSENLRSLTVIRRCSYVAGVGFASVFIVIAVNASLKTESSLYITRAMFNFASYVFSVGYMVMAVASIPVWRKELRNTASSFCSRPFSCGKTSVAPMPSRSRAMSQLYDTSGKKMYFNAQEEKEIYFSQLKLAWN